MKLTDLFAYPWLLPIALLLVPLVWRQWYRAKGRSAVKFSSIAMLPKFQAGWSAKARIILPILRSLAIMLLVICIARPQKIDEMTQVKTEGVAIELVVDRSGSMSADDFRTPRGRKITRLDAVKDVVQGFIKGDGAKLEGRQDDLVGLTVFARYPDTVCPLTWDHDHILRALKTINVPITRDEDGTAIGDALLLAVERIRNIGRRFQKGQDFKLTSRAVILLTDGEQNAGEHKPEEAAEAAKALGIKVYTIGAAPLFQQDQIGFFNFGPRPVPIDEDSLKAVADMTGGKYFRATDLESLAEVYAEIDKLERSEVDQKSYFLYEELAYRWIEIGPVKLPPPLAVAIALLLIEQILANTRLRKVP